MKNSIKVPAKASIWYIVSGILGKACAVLATPFFTRILTREEYGEFNLYMTLLGGASVVCSAFSTGSAVYKGLSNFKDKSDGFIKAVLCLSIGFTSIVCLVLFAFSLFFGINSPIIPVLSLQLFCDSILGVFYSEARYRYRYHEVCILSVIGYIFPPALSLLILWNLGGGYEIRIFALLAVSIASAIYALRKLTKSQQKIERGMISYSMKCAFPMLPHSISGALTAQTDKLIITALLGAGALAEYSVAHSLGISLSFLISTIGGALNPWIIRRMESGHLKQIAEVNSEIFSVLCAAAVFISAVAPEAVAILAPAEYSAAAGSVMPIALSVLPSFLISTITVALIFDEKGKYTISLSALGTLLCIILNYVFIRYLGYAGAGVALLLSQGLTAYIGIRIINKIGFSDIFNARELARSFITALGLGIVIRLLHSNPAARVMILIVPSIIILNAIMGLRRLIYEKGLPA